MLDPFDGLGEQEAAALGFRDAPCMLLVHEGPEARAIAVNDAASTFFGSRDGSGRPPGEVLAELLGPAYDAQLRRCFETGDAPPVTDWRLELAGPRGRTVATYLRTGLRRWEHAGRSGVCVAALDVTEAVDRRRRAEADEAAGDGRYGQARDLVLSMQDSLLPTALPVVPGLQTAGRYLLAEDDTAAGGDWLDVVALPSGRTALVVGDVVGHGVAASALMGQLSSVLAERLLAGVGAAAALDALDAYAAHVPEAHAATVAVVEIDGLTGEFDYCTAGHPPPLVVSGGDPTFLAPSGGSPLAAGGRFEPARGRLAAEDLLLLYSDGMIERPGRTPARSTVELAETAGGIVHDTAEDESPLADRVADRVMQVLVRPTGCTDDVTLLVAQRVRAPSTLELDEVADPSTLRTVRLALEEWLDRLDVSIVDGIALQHAVGECVTNAVEHAYVDAPGGPGRVTVRASLDRDGLARLTIADQGRWRTEPTEVPHGGRGMVMVGQLVDEVAVVTDDGGTTIELGHRLTRPVVLLESLREEPAPVRVADRLDMTGSGDRLAVRGSLDLVGAEELRGRLLSLADGRHPRVTIDLSGLTVLASAGVQLLVDALSRASAVDVSVDLVAPPGSVAQHVLGLVNLPHTGRARS